MYSIDVNWSEELQTGKWDNLGRNALENSCTHHDKNTGKSDNKANYYGYCEQCGISEDTAQPMMNYAYPLEGTPDEESILGVVRETNCTVMYNNNTYSYYLALCGGGMDLSQDIALAYIICETWIPKDLIGSIVAQKNFSVKGKNFELLKNEVIRQAEEYQQKFNEISDKWKSL